MDNKIDVISVILRTCHDVKDFVETANKVNGKVLAIQSEYVVDGKSTLGVMSLDTNIPISIKFIDVPDSEIFNFKIWEV